MMPYQLPPDIDQRVKAIVATGAYQTEDEVLREAIDALDERQGHISAIQRGIDDEVAGRLKTGDEVIEAIANSRSSSSSG